MTSEFMDLNRPEYSYMIGFLQCDGHMSKDSRNRGRVRVELSERDKDILLIFKNITPYYSSISFRERKTNFSEKSKTVIWSLYAQEGRTILKNAGLPCGSKSEIIEIPSGVIKEDYFRGVIDADGSVGMTGQGFPFISLTSKSEFLINGFLDFV